MGKDVGSVSDIAEDADCQAECEKHPDCLYWTLNRYGKKCWLKNEQAVDPALRRDYWWCASGTKTCSPKGK